MQRDNRATLAAVGVAIVGALFVRPAPALAQNGFPFQLVAQQSSSAQAVANGTTLTIAAASLNNPIQLTLTVTYIGFTSATLGKLSLVGTSAFTVTPSTPSATLSSGQSAAYSIVYTATTSDQVSALLTIAYTEASANGTGNSSGFISLGLVGTAPNLVVSYVLPPLSNSVPVSDGGTVQFPPTAVGSTSTAIVAITNLGTAAGTVQSVNISGPPFQTQSLPLLPGNIPSGSTLQITVLYTPTATQTDKGTLQLGLPSGTVTVNLAGTGIASQLQYQITAGGQQTTVSPNQTITVPDTNVGSVATVSVNVLNMGTSAAVINGITLTGQGFQITAAPALPLTLAPNGSATVTFTFTPTQAGPFTGNLRIGTDSFTVSGKGLGTLYTYSYASGSTTTTVTPPNGSLFFAPAQVGQTSSTTFTVTNGGTVAGTISSIFIGETNSPFSLAGLPPLPVLLAPGASVTFTVKFTPIAVGAATGTLHLDGTVFGLSGSGNPPSSLPAFSFTGASGTQAPLQQPSVGLNLSAPYPVAVSGTLTMNVVPDGFSADPAIQFSTGGRTVAFTIAANATAAVFANGSSTIKLQTGSTSGTITLVPSFQTAAGAQLTPANPQTLQLVVPQVAPILITAQVSAQAAAGITLSISGLSNSQNLNSLVLNFTPQPNVTLSAATLTIPLSGIASAWFQSAAAQASGGQFTITIPLAFTSTTTAVTAPAGAIASVSITATNNQGTSAPVVVSLQ